ncbi:hypothetical protein CAEBREN_02390 [Caenorhabditis brenneri]|uniref:Uncharacterized protein n=1 Tax=Caenorhabditis brenneri TaxID=135651 RepID=G0MYG3_CAEBE|nr:hypothetical protein CAEBREN_02390 [Caenorhabditis brenneri]
MKKNDILIVIALVCAVLARYHMEHEINTVPGQSPSDAAESPISADRGHRRSMLRRPPRHSHRTRSYPPKHYKRALSTMPPMEKSYLI